MIFGKWLKTPNFKRSGLHWKNINSENKNRVLKNFKFLVAKKVPKSDPKIGLKMVQNSTNIPIFKNFDILHRKYTLKLRYWAYT